MRIHRNAVLISLQNNLNNIQSREIASVDVGFHDGVSGTNVV